MPSAEAVLTVFIVGGLVAEAAVRARETTFPASGGEPVPLLGVLVPTSAVLMVCRLALALGPVIAFPAEEGWLLSTPADRRAILLPRILVTAAGGALSGFLIGLTGGFLAPDASLVGCLVLGAASGWCAVAAALCVQPSVAGHSTARRVVDAALVGAVLLSGVALWDPHLADDVFPAMGSAVRWGRGMVVVTIVVSTIAFVRLGRLDRRALTGGTSLVSALGTAASFLDPKVFANALLVRHCSQLATVRSRRLGVRPGRAVLRAELARVIRRPGAWGNAGAAALFVYIAWALMWPAAAVALHIVAAFVAVRPFSRGLEQVCRSTALRFALGISDGCLHALHLVVPVAVALLWSGVTAPAAGGSAVVVAPLAVFGAAATVYRLATRPDPDYGGVLIDTPLGVMPADLLRQVSRGPALLAAVCALAVILVAG